MNLWVDIINPSHALFFNSLLNQFNSNKIYISLRDRAETVALAKSFGLDGILVGRDYRNVFKKSLNIFSRTFQLYFIVDRFDYSLSFENGMSVAISKLRGKKSILLCDNDIKFFQSKNFFQDIETKIKLMAEYTIVPKACYDSFNSHIAGNNQVISYDGFKEDVYIADFRPDPYFNDKIPFENFVVLRPESLGSFYVVGVQSIIPDLLKRFKKHNINIVYLPREKEDFEYAKGFDVYIPKNPLNGLDLCYYADVVLTGSGTMAREAACLGVPSVSFFPGKNLLSVDKKLVQDKKILHSRNPREITDFVLSNSERKGKSLNIQRSKKVKNEVVNIIERIIYEN